MGLNDVREQLDVCRSVQIDNERRIADLEHERDALLEKLRTRTAELEVAFDLEKGLVAELEHENARLESALGDRMRTDSHGTAALEADLVDARERLARIGAFVDPRRDDWNALSPIIIRRILDETTAEPFGVYLTPDDAELVGRACRHSAAIIHALQAASNEVGPIAPDVASFATRIDALADRIGARRE